jgi:hypothetical protein
MLRKVFANLAGPLLELSKCPEFVVNRERDLDTDRFNEEPRSATTTGRPHRAPDGLLRSKEDPMAHDVSKLLKMCPAEVFFAPQSNG